MLKNLVCGSLLSPYHHSLFSGFPIKAASLEVCLKHESRVLSFFTRDY